MKVYVVIADYETRNNPWEVKYEIFDTKEEAKKYFDDQVKWALIDYEIDTNNETLELTDESAVYITGDWEAFEIYLEEREVKQLYDYL